ncbi:MAG TPA: ATP-binding cassette domain-containing protein [Thermoanaerobaculia bacterium]|jgi:ABC-2 type transport system ATP-binding protein|nr:ATP-binding cassette domain-containing protein [Thermoanaerobaculia bacterium]
MQPTLELQGLRKRFDGTLAVDDVTLAVPPGTVFGLLGPNGAGKTTTIRMLMDIIGPDSGEVRVFGHPRTRADLDRIGYLPEERGLYRKMTLREQLIFLGELHGLPKKTLGAKADGWLERMGLADRAKAKVEELSKGMQQKVQLAGTMLHDPDLLVLDEPFSGLDPINQVLFKDTLAQHKAASKTVLFSTHVMEQAERLCDHIALIARGRVVLAGELAAIKREMGANSYRLVATGDLERLRRTPGIVEVAGSNGDLRLRAETGVDGARLLRELVSFLEVHEFRSAEPTLEEIFVKVVHDANA